MTDDQIRALLEEGAANYCGNDLARLALSRGEELAQAERDMHAFIEFRDEQMRQWAKAVTRAEKAEAERDTALVRAAELEAREKGLRRALELASYDQTDFLQVVKDYIEQATDSGVRYMRINRAKAVEERLAITRAALTPPMDAGDGLQVEREGGEP